MLEQTVANPCRTKEDKEFYPEPTLASAQSWSLISRRQTACLIAFISVHHHMPKHAHLAERLQQMDLSQFMIHSPQYMTQDPYCSRPLNQLQHTRIHCALFIIPGQKWGQVWEDRIWEGAVLAEVMATKSFPDPMLQFAESEGAYVFDSISSYHPME